MCNKNPATGDDEAARGEGHNYTRHVELPLRYGRPTVLRVSSLVSAMLPAVATEHYLLRIQRTDLSNSSARRPSVSEI